MSDPASIKKALSAQFSVDVPPPLDSVDPEALALALKQPNAASSILVLDVRQAEEFRLGNIAGSRNTPLDEIDFDALSKEVAESRKNGAAGISRVVFVSLQSPDIDDAAAQDFVKAFEDLSSRTAGASSPSSSSSFVQLLLGGVFHWLQLYRNDTSLTASYDAANWESSFAKGPQKA